MKYKYYERLVENFINFILDEDVLFFYCFIDGIVLFFKWGKFYSFSFGLVIKFYFGE